jgi:RNA 2',3'-cyclic 3'-phosphodiesterase
MLCWGNMNKVRAFIAIPLSAEIQKNLDEVSGQLRNKLGNEVIRWVKSKNIHLTLKFLGDVEGTDIEPIKQILDDAAAQIDLFEFEVGGIGAFPSNQRARVIWIGIQAPGQLMELQKSIDLKTAALGYASEERSFSPHLTLGRVRKSTSVSKTSTAEDIRRIGQILQEVKVDKLGENRVEAVHLYKSELQPGGSVYTVLHRAAFKNQID